MQTQLLLAVVAAVVLISCKAQLLGGPVAWDGPIDFADVQRGSALLPASNSMYGMPSTQPVQQTAATPDINSMLLSYVGQGGMPARQQSAIPGSAADPQLIMQQILAQQSQNKPTPWPQALDPTAAQASSSSSNDESVGQTVQVTPGHPAMNWGNSWDVQSQQFDNSLSGGDSQQLADQTGYYYPDESYTFESGEIDPSGVGFEMLAVPEQQEQQQQQQQQEQQQQQQDSAGQVGNETPAELQQDFDQLFSAMLSIAAPVPVQDVSTPSSSSSNGNSPSSSSSSNIAADDSAQLEWRPTSPAVSAPKATQLADEQPSQGTGAAQQQTTQQQLPHQDEQQWHTYKEQPKQQQQKKQTQEPKQPQRQHKQQQSTAAPAEEVTYSTFDAGSKTSSSTTATKGSKQTGSAVMPETTSTQGLEVAVLPGKYSGNTGSMTAIPGFVDYGKVHNAAGGLLSAEGPSNTSALEVAPPAAATTQRHKLSIGASVGIAFACCTVAGLAVVIVAGVVRRIRAQAELEREPEINIDKYFTTYSADSECDLEAAKAAAAGAFGCQNLGQSSPLHALQTKRRLQYGSCDGSISSHGGLSADWWATRSSSFSSERDADRAMSPARVSGCVNTPLVSAAKQQKGL